MVFKCCILNCNSQRPIVRLFRFPKTEIGLNHVKWIKCIPGGNDKSFRELRKSYICEKHFEAKCFTTRFRLHQNAFPTLFSADEIASGVPDISDNDIENINPNMEHNYSLPECSDHTYTKQQCSSLDNIYPNMEHNYSLLKHSDHTYSTQQGSSMDDATEVEFRARTFPQMSTLPEGSFQTCPSINNNQQPCSSKTINTLPPNIKTPKRAKRRVISNSSLLTPNCKKLYKEYNKCKRKLEFCRKTKANAVSFSKEKSFDFLTKKLPDLGKKLIWMQIQQAKKRQKGRRFTKEDKMLCLSIFKQSPKCYRFLQKIFILPGKTTLNKFVSELQLEPGINKQVFAAISKEVASWEENKKFCSIIFDEVALEPTLTYEKHKDIINGLVDLEKRTNDIADHALCFMLRGAFDKWVQPISFYYCKGQTNTLNLKNIIRAMVAEVCATGLKPITVICDQGAAFQSAIKSFQEDSKREQILKGEEVDDTININNCRMCIIYDPPHLIKGLRNNFLTKNIKFQGKLAQWNDLVDAYKTDCRHAHSRLLHKLTDEYVIPERIKKMKVKNCARVFSNTMAATLSYTSEFSMYADGRPVSATLKNTADVVEFFDKLFDSVNGKSFKTCKELRTIVTETSKHHAFWQQAIIKLGDLKYINKAGKEVIVPTIKNWVTTLKSFQWLWQFCQQNNIQHVRPRYFNSDPIENFFGQMRAYNYRNNNPDCHTFQNTFKALLITRFIQFHSNTFNSEEVLTEQLLNLQSLFNSKHNKQRDFNEFPETSHQLNQLNPEFFNNMASQERLQIHSHAYTTGWLVRKILKNKECSTCESNLTAEINSIHKWISLREFKVVTGRKLVYPSEKTVRLFKDINLIKSKYCMDFFDCDQHKDICDIFLDYALLLIIYNWCKTINKILKGTDILRLTNRLPPMQAKALEKYKRKLKNKK